ncbi:MAG: spore germination protein GerW family protein [Henriciella sp.]|nr:spore germination protein GerW family protein [Henriciella sp.]
MNEVENLLKGTVEELDKLLNAKNVLGDPIERDGATIIPMVSYGFGFGAGGTSNIKDGPGGGSGGGGGIKPLGAIIIDKEGARVEGIRGAMRTLAEVIGETASHAMDKPAGRDSSTRSKKS